METFPIYLLKSAAVLGIFFLTYQLFLKRETFFTPNRHFLLGGLLASLLLPLVIFTKYNYVEASFLPTPAITDFTAASQETPLIASSPAINWWNILLAVYMIGMAVMVFRVLLQFISLQKLFKNSLKRKLGKLTYVEVNGKISPFSFFNYIIYNPSMYATDELKAIIEHEQAHCRQWHSLDMILSELFLAFQWCNPFAWLYKRNIQQNLEYIADNEATSSVASVKSYQRTMLKVSLNNYCTAITNNFFNSLIKKRIIMINQHPSKRRNQWKFLAVVPLLTLFLVSFNTKEVTKTIEPSTEITNGQPNFVSPIEATKIKSISAGFGMKMNPFSKKKEFHKGIDLIANTGTPVMATAGGIVNIAGSDDSKGNYVVIEHQDGYGSKYFHLKSHTVSKGQKVAAGDIIGHVGNTGLSTGTHLHFEILKDANAIDPQQMLPSLTKVSKGKVLTKPLQSVTPKEKEKPSLDTKGSYLTSNYAGGNKPLGLHPVSHQPSQPFKIKITKDMSDDDLDALKKKVKTAYGYDFKYSRLKRNSANMITSISFSLTNGDDKVNGSYSNPEGIPNIFLGENEDGGVYMTSNTEHLHEHSLKAHVHAEEGHDLNIKKLANINAVKIQENKSNDDFKYLTGNLEGALILKDGKEVEEKTLKSMDPDQIESINVLKGKAAIKKHGAKAKNSVIEIITKKE